MSDFDLVRAGVRLARVNSFWHVLTRLEKYVSLYQDRGIACPTWPD
jgi:hypothetical protein